MLEVYLNRLERYKDYFEKEIKETQTFFDQLEVLGRYSAYSLYDSKHELKYLISYLESNGIEVSEYRKKYLFLCRKLKETEDFLGESLREKLMEEFQYDVENFWRYASSFLDPSVVDEADNDLDHRTSIEILRTELRRDHDLHEIDIKVAALDRVLRFKYERNIANLSDQEICNIELWNIYLPPDPFWWVHPSLILAQRGPDPIDTSSLHFARHGPDFGLSGELIDHKGLQKYFEQACCLASRREGVEVYSQADIHNLIVYDRGGNTLAAGNEKGESSPTSAPPLPGSRRSPPPPRLQGRIPGASG